MVRDLSIDEGYQWGIAVGRPGQLKARHSRAKSELGDWSRSLVSHPQRFRLLSKHAFAGEYTNRTPKKDPHMLSCPCNGPIQIARQHVIASSCTMHCQAETREVYVLVSPNSVPARGLGRPIFGTILFASFLLLKLKD